VMLLPLSLDGRNEGEDQKEEGGELFHHGDLYRSYWFGSDVGQ
jgi:hypothetical protein